MVRLADPEESQTVVDWLNGNPDNDFDPGILKYPTLQVLCSYNGIGPLAYLPMHRGLILESTARRPGLSDVDSVQALRDLVKGAELIASANKIREMFFLMSDEAIAKVAMDHGFEMKRALRLKL